MKATATDRILAFLDHNRGIGYTPLEIAHALKLNPHTVRRTVRQMDLAGEVDRFGGRYIAFSKDILAPAAETVGV